MNKSKKHISRCWTVTEETLEQLKYIGEELGETNMSATLRYCVRKVYKQFLKEEG